MRRQRGLISELNSLVGSVTHWMFGGLCAGSELGCMYRLSDKLIQELQDVVRREYGKEMTWEEAQDAGNNLAEYFLLLAKIDSRPTAAPVKAPRNVTLMSPDRRVSKALPRK